MLTKWKERAQKIKENTLLLYYALKNPKTPWYAKFLAAVVVGYALSPIDLIPDFIPILGHLDDLLIVSLGFYIVMKMIPADVIAESRKRLEEKRDAKKPVNWIAATIIIIIWVLAIILAVVIGRELVLK
jgi:uncharacterized membrane protein YkvA (DUF1232 family)